MSQTRLPVVVALGILALTLGSSSVRAEEKPLRQRIDAEVRAAWQREQLNPVARTDDATFLRRIYLDLAGTIPTSAEVRQFLADGAADKRAKLIDRLLDDPRVAANQATVWDLVLFGRNPAGYDATRRRDVFKKWLTDQFTRNVPYDRWVRDLLLAEQEGPPIFYVQYRNQPEDATVAVSRIFLGTQLQCARCHDHPFEGWTQRDFYGMAAFFSRLVIVEDGPDAKRRYLLGEKSSGDVLFTGPASEQKPGQKGEPIKPKFLGGAALAEPVLPKDFKEVPLKPGTMPPRPTFSRKEKLAAWIATADNPWFARAAANRVWAQFMGRGLVHPVDDLSPKHEPSHPALLNALTEELVAHKFDLKWLIREIVNSEAYQVGATGPTREALPKWYDRARVRPLSAEEMMAGLAVATGFDASASKPEEKRLPGDTVEYMLRYFGEPTDGRGVFQASLTEHLFLNNADNVRRLIARRKGNLADKVLTSTSPWEARVEELFLAVLSRPPRPEERQRFVAYLGADAKKTEVLVEEAIWVLLNTSEFRFNH
jgi:hypothetical protein